MPTRPNRILRLASSLPCALLLAGAARLGAQAVVTLPAAPAITQSALQPFHFVSDGPRGPGWSRPDEIARVYFPDELPALFTRTLRLDASVPQGGKLQWIFTGPHAGFTVELTGTKVRVFQRYYDSAALWNGSSNYPDKVTRDDEQQFTGEARTLTVVLDAHLSLSVLVNGVRLLQQTCTFDVLRHQALFAAPRSRHLVLDGSLLAEPGETATVTVDPTHTHQRMLGFGGSPSIPAYRELTEAGREQYWALLKRYNLLIDREYPMGTELKPDLSNLEDGRDATPHYYGDNFPNSELSDFSYSQHALALGGSVIYEMWALPAWATVPRSSSAPVTMDSWDKPVRRVADPEKYAAIVVEYCRLAKQRTGSAPAIVGVENEVEQPPEVFAQMTLVLRRELDKAGFTSTKIHMADASFLYQGITRVEQLRATPAWAATDFTTSHEYDFQEFFANPDLYDARMKAMHTASEGKPFLATEICVNDPHYQEPSYRIAFQVAQLYSKNLTELDAEMLLYCWLLLDVEQPTFGGSRSLLVPDKTDANRPVASSFQLRVLGAYSRHILAGMVRVDAAASSPDLLVSAFASEGHHTLVVLNRSTSAQRLSTVWPGVHWTEAERTDQREANAAGAAPANLILAPGEILTLSDFHAPDQ